MQVRVKKLKEEAKVPEFAHQADAGMDLYSVESYTLDPGEVRVFDTGIAVELPEGYTAFAKDRSSMASKNVHVLAGVLDSGYRGEWGTTLVNHSDQPVEIEKHQKIAQFVVLPIPEVEIEEVENLSDSKRGQGGFGSTGKF
jgi:dUTP pyrophosphatase